MSDEPRLPNLQKLYHVPVFALRTLLDSRVPDRKFGHLRQAELVAEADRLPAITPDDVENLYENYRYGRRLSFYLYLLPEGLDQPQTGALQDVLDNLALPQQSSLTTEAISSQDYEGDANSDLIILLDEEQVDDIREIRFRHFVAHRFLNADEQPDEVLQTRYGFLWLDLVLGYLAILSRDEHVNHLLMRALAHCLQAIPVPVRLDKELVDKHFSIEQIKRVSHYDPDRGIRQSISGRNLWSQFEHEILDREKHYTRPSSLYDEEVADGVVSGLGITARKGKIYLTKTLPTSLVRTWAMRRLPDLVRDLKDLRSERPEIFGRSVEAINRMRLRAEGKAAITALVEALLEVDRDELTSTSLSLSALNIYTALEGKYFTPYLRALCGDCEEIADLCPHCESSDLAYKDGRVRCRDCKATLSEGESVALRCMDGHATRVALTEALSIAPNHWLQKRMVSILEEIGHRWQERGDYFYVEGNTLYRLHKGKANGEELPPVVNHIVNNFWELNGQVHTGSGNIVSPSVRASHPPEPEAAVKQDPWPYRNFDLRLRGSALTGYTVEAAASDGGSVSPHSLALPRDRAFELDLSRVLQQRTDADVLRAVGSALAHALFPPPITRLWAAARGRLEAQMGLRLRLHIDQPELMALPWELLYDEGFIGLHLGFPVVRYLDVADRPKPLAVEPPLRILVAMAQPHDQRPVDGAAELAAIAPALGELAGKVEMEVMASASREKLQAELRQGYHVLHYIGHGTFERGEGYLILEDAQGRSDPVSARLLGQLVTGSNLRLAILNACATATIGQVNPYGGLAHQLVGAGMAAVVAMQLPIAEGSAYAFSREFYAALADGWPVDAAVQEGRRSIMNALGNSWHECVDWAIPTLYMRAPEGVILSGAAR
jgi:hypothetical protein